MTTGELVLPDTMVGMIEASTTRRLVRPCTRSLASTTAIASAVKLKKNKNHVLKVDHLITFGSCTFKWCYHADAVALGAQLGPAKRK